MKNCGVIKKLCVLREDDFISSIIINIPFILLLTATYFEYWSRSKKLFIFSNSIFIQYILQPI